MAEHDCPVCAVQQKPVPLDKGSEKRARSRARRALYADMADDEEYQEEMRQTTEAMMPLQLEAMAILDREEADG